MKRKIKLKYVPTEPEHLHGLYNSLSSLLRHTLHSSSSGSTPLPPPLLLKLIMKINILIIPFFEGVLPPLSRDADDAKVDITAENCNL
jgi:hypothetical protein